jgi:Tfp pilus assembly protein PilN
MTIWFGPEMAKAQRFEKIAWDAAILARRCHTSKLPPDEWVKRLKTMAVKIAQSSLMSTEEALDSILSVLDRANAMTANRAAEITINLQAHSGPWPTAEPEKPRPKKWRGKQLAKWPYGWRK